MVFGVMYGIYVLCVSPAVPVLHGKLSPHAVKPDGVSSSLAADCRVISSRGRGAVLLPAFRMLTTSRTMRRPRQQKCASSE